MVKVLQGFVVPTQRAKRLAAGDMRPTAEVVVFNGSTEVGDRVLEPPQIPVGVGTHSQCPEILGSLVEYVVEVAQRVFVPRHSHVDLSSQTMDIQDSRVQRE
ncbi:hypothetical protein Aglo03_20790 [Actinokineospora globicatena]|uniref:Uncharacterized protein n=1 Tax=Actinokineospora globicatena TaxID=103729 RepID=A0A9W6V9S5_9PSEU|nr:hypothetical protein [Actinokineospora globicatena]GLW91263.1 hypothetical protein Aglo03_20790 [Actinokineospora globicatena]